MQETIVEEGPAIDLMGEESLPKKPKLHEPLDDFPEAALQPYIRGRLQSEWDKTGMSGAGTRILERLKKRRNEPRARSRSRGEPDEGDDERTAFLSERIEVPKGTNKNVRKQMAGRNLKYDAVDSKTRAKLDASRSTEWKK